MGHLFTGADNTCAGSLSQRIDTSAPGQAKRVFRAVYGWGIRHVPADGNGLGSCWCRTVSGRVLQCVGC